MTSAAPYDYRLLDDARPTAGVSTPDGYGTACPKMAELEPDALETCKSIPSYLIFTTYTPGRANNCMNMCVASLGGSSVIHTTLYLPALEQTFTAVKDTGARCRDVHDFTQLHQDDSQRIYEFRTTYQQFRRMKDSIYAHLNEPYDGCMVAFGWLHFICSSDVMNACCTQEGTQTCSRFVMGALIDAGVITDIDKTGFILPGQVERIVDNKPFDFERVQWEVMRDNVCRWYEETRAARRGVHAVAELDILSSSSSSSSGASVELGTTYHPYSPFSMASLAAGPASGSGVQAYDDGRSEGGSTYSVPFGYYSTPSVGAASHSDFDPSPYVYL